MAIAAGLSATAIGVYGGVLVPGLLLLGVDPRFAAAASLFLQVLVIPLGAGAHYRLGNVSRHVAVPLIVGGMVGAFVGPFFAAALPKDVIARLVAGVIVGVGVLVLATLRWGGLGERAAAGRGAHGARRWRGPDGRVRVGCVGRRLGPHRREAADPARASSRARRSARRWSGACSWPRAAVVGFMLSARRVGWRPTSTTGC